MRVEGWVHSCAIADDGQMKCWGFGNSGRLGYGDTLNRGDSGGVRMGENLPFLDLGDGELVESFATGQRALPGALAGHSCVILTSGGLKCWGKNGNGQWLLVRPLPKGFFKNASRVSPPSAETMDPSLLKTKHSQLPCPIRIEASCQRTKIGDESTTAEGNNQDEMGDFLAYVDLGNPSP
eukprot:5581971-Amphidinium_carterae.1